MLSIVIVNWNTRDELRQCLHSIKTHVKSRLETEVIVVDNASSDKSADMVSKFYPWVKLVKNDKNVGFGTACNMGADLTRGEVLAFINPDISFSSDSVIQLLDFLDEQPNVGVVAPKLLYDDGKLQPSVRRFPTTWVMLLMLTKLSLLARGLTSWKRYNYSNFNYENMRSVEQVMGAAMFIKRDVFEEVGKFDPSYFVWFEEVDLCKRIKEAGYLIFYIPAVEMYHTRSRSFAKQTMFERQINFSYSARVYARKHFSLMGQILVWFCSWLALILVFLVSPFDSQLKKYQATERR